MNEQIQQKIEKLQALDVALTELEIVSDFAETIYSDGSAGFSFPRNVQVIKDLDQKMAEHGFEMTGEHQYTDDGTLSQYWRRDDTEIILYFRVYLTGASCKLNLLRTETKTVPVYEVVCLEA